MIPNLQGKGVYLEFGILWNAGLHGQMKFGFGSLGG
jgi:hypothetical protein